MSIRINNRIQEPSAHDLTKEAARAPDAQNSKEFSGAGKIGGNILSLGTGEIIARVAAFVGTTFAARELGPEQFGIVGFAVALFSYFSIAVSGGFNDIGSLIQI